MHPIDDVDALLLLAAALAGKRRPATVDELVAAYELIAGKLPYATGFSAALARLSTHGLLLQSASPDAGFALGEAARDMLVGDSPKADLEARLLVVKQKLAAYAGKAKHPAATLDEAQVKAAIEEYRATLKAAAPSLLTPKPRPSEAPPRPGARQRKPLPARGRRQ